MVRLYLFLVLKEADFFSHSCTIQSIVAQKGNLLTMVRRKFLLLFLAIGLPSPQKGRTEPFIKILDDPLTERDKEPPPSLPAPTNPVKKSNQPPPKRTEGPRPKLVLIIDDIGFLSQYQEITKIGLRITPSIFPKTSKSPDGPKIAQLTEFYMLHLPLQYDFFVQKELFWLFESDTLQTMQDYLHAIREQFPNVVYANNHTGGRFTANIEAMRRLYRALDEQKIEFLDSRTIGPSKAPQVAQEMKKELLARDVFIDNERHVPYIEGQIAEAIRIAKKKGYAIAIGHPHKETFMAIERLKTTLQQEVELVYPYELSTPKSTH